MKNWILLLIVMASGQATAQLTNAKGWYDNLSKIEDRKIGWIDVLKFTTPAKPYAKDGWSYSSKEVEASQKLTGWLQQTYTPTGMLGEMKQSFLANKESFGPDTKYFGANEAEKYNRRALPNTYGFYARLHQCLVKTATREFWPMPGNLCYHNWFGMVNNVELISRQQIYLSGPDDYYCTQPRYSLGMKGEFGKEWREKAAQYRDFTTSPALQKYDHYLLPAKSISQDADTYVVILSKDHKPLPFEPVTMTQLISRLEERLPTMEKLYYNSSGTTQNILEKMKHGIAVMKEQFRNNMNDAVYLYSSTTEISPLDIASFELGKPITMLMVKPSETNKYGNTTVGIPLLRMKKGTKEACATGPQWIVYRLDSPIRVGYGGSVDMMDHFVNKYDYNYVYNYFFGNGNGITPYKAIEYKSADEVNASKPLVAASEATKRYATDKNVLFFDDLSTTAIGGIPANWFLVKDADGNKPTVVAVSGAPGKWLRLKKHAYPATFTQPLSGDFTLSYDVLVQKGDVPWGTPGMQLQLYTDGQPNTGSSETSVNSKYRFSLDVSPGDMNRNEAAGWIMIGKVMPPGYFTCQLSNYYSLPQLTGSKPVNKATVTIQRKGEGVTVLCNNSKVFACEKAFPADMSFHHLRFYVNEKNVFHISNILITKE